MIIEIPQSVSRTTARAVIEWLHINISDLGLEYWWLGSYRLYTTADHVAIDFNKEFDL